MLVVVAYDMRDDKRREKLRKLLKDYGAPVQLSVFECMLDKDQVVRLKKKAAGLIRKGEDSVNFYPLCERCQAKVSSVRRTDEALNKLTVVA